MRNLTRRSFLKTGMAAAAAGIAAPRALGANERIRMGVIGGRNRGHQVATDMARNRNFEIATVCDCDTAMAESAVAEILKGSNQDEKPKLEQDFRRVLEDRDIDAVIIAAPDHWHAHMQHLALDAGKHVYVEKPASFNIAESVAMTRKAKAHPELTVMVGTQQRSGRHFKDAKAFVEEGRLGKIGFCRTWITQNRPVLPIVPDTDPPQTMDYEMWVGPAPYQPYNEYACHYWWHFQKEYGTGEIGNWGAHWIDIARWYLNLGLPNAVSGQGHKIVQDAKETPDTQTVIYEFPELTVLWEQRIWTEYRISGESSGLELCGDKGALMLTRGGWTFYPAGGKPEKHDGSDLMGPHVHNFAEVIQGRAECNAPMEEGARTASMCHLGNLVARLNRRLEFDAATQSFPKDPEANELRGRAYRAPWSELVRIG